MSWEHAKATLRGAVRSLTVWAATVIALLPEALPLVQQNFSAVAPFIPESLHSRTLQFIALLMLLLRIRTNNSLAAKGGKSEPSV